MQTKFISIDKHKKSKKYFLLQYAIYQCITFISKIILKIFCILFAQTIAQ